MPIYEYGCEACGHTLEIQQKFSDDPLRTCPACGKDELRKLISATAFVLKGSGWYKDGYGSKKGDGKGAERTENQRSDRLQKALDEDKKKTAAAAGGDSGASTSTPAASTPSSSSSSSGSSGSSGGGSSGTTS